VAQQIWNLLGGFKWTGFEIACEMHGVEDPHEVALLLAAIREHFQEQSEQRRT